MRWRRGGSGCAVCRAVRSTCRLVSGPGPRSSRAMSCAPRHCLSPSRASRRRSTWCTRWGRVLRSRRLIAGRLRRSGRRRCAAGVGRIVYLGGLGEGGALGASFVAAGGRPDPARVGGADDRVPLVDRDRLGERVVRDAPRAGGAAARDGHAALGEHAHAADRDRGCDRLFAGGPRLPAGLGARCSGSAAPTSART